MLSILFSIVRRLFDVALLCDTSACGTRRLSFSCVMRPPVSAAHGSPLHALTWLGVACAARRVCAGSLGAERTASAAQWPRYQRRRGPCPGHDKCAQHPSIAGPIRSDRPASMGRERSAPDKADITVGRAMPRRRRNMCMYLCSGRSRRAAVAAHT